MLTMYDDVNLSLIPANAQAVAGYVNGRWPTFNDVVKRWPNAKHLSIAVTAEADADCLDIERGDALPEQAPNWVRRQIARGVKRPAVYCAVSDAPKVTGLLDASGIKRTQYRLITAHYTGHAHLCGASCWPGFKSYADATQYTDKALGRSLDATLVSNDFFAVPVNVAARRAALRRWILVRRAVAWPWSWIKASQHYKEWRRLGGR